MASTIPMFSHLQIPLEDVVKATNNFADENIISRGGFGKAYKGRLTWSGELMNISARRKHREVDDVLFWREISVLSDIKHKNIVSLIGFCDEKDEKIIITTYEANGSLMEHLSNLKLTWLQRLRICVGAARALSYLHYDEGRSYGVIHRNISSYTILLDENWEAKLSGFEISLTQSVNRMDEVLLCDAVGTEGYMEPEIEKTGGVTHKSDIFSFGVVLFEILCGKKAFMPNQANRYLAPLAKLHYENYRLEDIIDPDLYRQIDDKSRIMSSEAAYSSLKTRVQRPNMKQVIDNLELALQHHRKHINYMERLQLQVKRSNSEHLKISLDEIKLATDNFSQSYRIRSKGFYELYRAKINYFQKDNSSSVEGKNDSTEVPKRHKTVVIKRIRPKRYDEKFVFFKDLAMLTSCMHRGVVTLIGFCDENPEMILVIEHLSNGYLSDYLRNNNGTSNLRWAKRLKICLDVAHALNYLHCEMEDQKMICRAIKSNCIALDENWRAKIVAFGIRAGLFAFEDDDTLYVNHDQGEETYINSNYNKNLKLQRESDVKHFGVVLFEIFCGRLADDRRYTEDGDDGLASVARRCFRKGTLKDMIDPVLKEERDNNLNRKPNKDSLDIYLRIAYQCVATTRDQRPTMEMVIKELEKALSFQEQNEDLNQVVNGSEKALQRQLTPKYPETIKNAFEKAAWNNRKVINLGKKLEHLKIPLSDIKLATNNFSTSYRIDLIGSYTYYPAKLNHFVKKNSSFVEGKINKDELPKSANNVVIKRITHPEDIKAQEAFFTETEMLTSCKHCGIVSLVGFCDERSQMILVTEHLSNGLLGDYLGGNTSNLSWAKRLKICLDVAHALNYLHSEMEDQKVIINRNIKSNIIGLDENWRAKIVNFEISVFLPPNQEDEALHLDVVHGTPEYTDPEYELTHKLKRESDVYSFGVVLFEIFCGRFANDLIYVNENDKGLAYVARRSFDEGKLMEMVDPVIKEETSENNSILNRGPNKDSLDTFLNIAYQCVTQTQDQRPTMKDVIKELEKALTFQENHKKSLKIALEDIKLATENFNPHNRIGGGGFGNVYKGKVQKGDEYDIIVAKRLDTSLGQGETQFLSELQILFEYEHANIIRLLGYCDENDDKIIVYEYASRGSLDKYLNDNRLTWMKRLEICIDVATALDFLHGGAGTQATVIHRDIKAANILLNDDWKAKLADFGLSLISAINQKTDYVIDHACGTPGYLDPLYEESGFLTMESDIYSFGVVLFEILGGRSTYAIYRHERRFLPSFIKRMFDQGKHDDVVFDAIKDQISPKSLTTFQRIASQCLDNNREKRPKAKEVLAQLQMALKFQEDHR